MLKLVFNAITGFGILLILIALISLFSGAYGAFFAVFVVGGVFIGLSWAGRRMLLPGKDDQPPDVGLVAGVIFGGSGMIMIIGSLFLYWDGEFGGAVGLFLFGAVFCGAGYAGYRVFRVPAGKKAVMIGERQQAVRGVFVTRGRRTSRHYVYVDKDLPESQVIEMQKNWSGKPWLQRSDWAEGMSVQNGAGSNNLLTLFTITWNIISFALAGFALASTWGSGDEPWFILIFPFVGIALIIVTVRTRIRSRKYGISILKIETLPAILGQEFKGVIETNITAKSNPPEGFHVRLVCIERRSILDREGDKRVSEEKLWSMEQQVEGVVSNGDDRIIVRISVALPEDLPPTKLIPEDDRSFWQIEVSASMPGVDYAAQFEIPVFIKDLSGKAPHASG